MTKPIEFSLNGRPALVEVDPLKPLLRVLREDLGLKGVKQACDLEGECGACTVIVDGQAVRSCLLPVAKVAGRAVTTIEGLGSREQPHPLQEAFLEAGAVQCGFCTPGMLLAAKALLDRRPHPSRAEIIQALEGNLCRCTGYVKIVDAVERAAQRMGGAAGTDPASPAVRAGGWERVTGQAQYAEDMELPGLRYLAVARGTPWHARLVGLDVTPALALPGVLRVLTAADVPGDNKDLGGYSPGEPLLTPVGGTLRTRGDPLALVIGVTPEAAAAGAAAIAAAANFEVLPHTFDVDAALAPGALPIHADGNLLAESQVVSGDLAAALAGSAHVVEAGYQTSFQVPMALEREAALAYVDEAGRVVVIGGNHEPHWVRAYLAAILRLPPDRVRVQAPAVGGSFGGKQDIWPLAAAAIAAYRLAGPVRLAYTRREVLAAAPKRHPYACQCAIGVDAAGRLTGLRFEARINTGAYDSGGRHTAEFATTASVGAYRWQAVASRARTVYTNAPKAGQMRGYGTPQAVFVTECTLDELAEQIGDDPLAFRRRNALLDGQPSGLGYPLEESLGYAEVLDALRPDYQAALDRAAAFNAAATGSRRGVGLAGMWYRFGKFGAAFSQAEVELGRDGRFTVYCSSVDYGQGIATVFVEMAGQALGVPAAQVRLTGADTATTLDADIPGASRNTFWAGAAVADAARRLKGLVLAAAAEMLDAPPDTLHLHEGIVRRSDDRGAGVDLAAIAAELERTGQPRRVRGSMDLRGRVALPAALSSRAESERHLPFFVTGAQMAEVEVNLHTGEVQVLSMAAAHDVGHAINRRDAEGQVEGGIMMGLGTALMEEYLPGLNTGFSNYYVPTARSLPRLAVHLVEVPSRWGPQGAKGLGEAVTLPTAPAIVNAISRAIGARVRALPATPERVLAAIATRQTPDQGAGENRLRPA